MIESVKKAWDKIENILMDRDNETDLRRLNAIDRTKLEQLFCIIEPFRAAILEMEKTTHPTLPGVVFVHQTLLKSLTPSEGDETWMQSLKQRLVAAKKKLQIFQEHRIATILHPSFRSLQSSCVNANEKWHAYNAIRNMLSNTSGQEIDQSEERGATGPTFDRKRSRIAMDSFLDEFCTPDQNSVADELNRYLADPVSKVLFADILSWWKVASKTYPKLAAVARKYLAIPATSAASESSFRYAGLTVTELRNRLSPETVSDLLFVRHYEEQ